MGLQTWTPNSSPLSSMACLDVETPSICMGKFKSVLQLRLQQRRTREQLVEQGIMPPLKTPVAFHEQIRNLERARTGNFLKHKLCSRPQRSELVRMHILQETQAEPSLQATQMKLKRARLTDDLNEKIAQRPGPMELVEKNILPVDEVVHGPTGDKVIYSKPPDIYSFEEDSSDALSPEQPSRQQSPSSTSTSPNESGGIEAVVICSNTNTPIQANSQSSDSISLISTREQQSNQQASSPQPTTYVASKITTGSVLVKQSLPKLSSDKSRSKRSKEPKPRVKKLKYHQYIPPDQKLELNEVQMDSAYARLLQQQQQFLQLQILSQQQYNYQAVAPSTIKPTAEVKTSCSTAVLSENAASNPVHPRHTKRNRKLDHLPAKLDEMKVAELKMELKLRSLPVSGTKTDLIERLKLYLEDSNTLTAIETTAVTAASQSESKKLTPPVSPIASKVSTLGLEDSIMTDSTTKHSVNSTQRNPQGECSTETRSNEKNSEKDKRLHEKERQIEELIRKLEQEQRLVEELKMQLEVEKMSQQGNSPPHLSPLPPVQVKEENKTPSDCSASCSSPGVPVMVKQEEIEDQCHLLPYNRFNKSHKTVKPAETLQPVQVGAQILRQASLPASAATIPLPANGIKLHAAASSADTSLIQTSGQLPQTIESSSALQCSSQLLTKTWRMESTFPTSECHVGSSSCQDGPKRPTNEALHPTQQAFSQQSKFTNHLPKCKDPPRYEDAIKQTRSIPVAVQIPTASSQQMDDLFDVLIESGEISPFIRQNPPSQDKPLPVTASVTTLPINTVLSRPPPVVQVAQLPPAQMNPSASLEVLTSDTQLKSLLDGILNTHAEPPTLKLIEELQSPLVTMEVDTIENMPPSSMNLHSANIDSMDWLDLNLSVQAGGVSSLDMSTPAGVFSSDFLDSSELQLNWD
ncbi:myocardin-related transcription factor B isoform X2 [Antennarius striatus]|uniref:myocardin-related transcription factor B isoform X2 n=1 Tax=Antennarius striatus TaxID=241820 RepID=UPI0035B0705A